MFEPDSTTISQMSATILAGLLANPKLVQSNEIDWDAMCEDADQAAKNLLERARE
jgi:hypothetical protein